MVAVLLLDYMRGMFSAIAGFVLAVYVVPVVLFAGLCLYLAALWASRETGARLRRAAKLVLLGGLGVILLLFLLVVVVEYSGVLGG